MAGPVIITGWKSWVVGRFGWRALPVKREIPFGKLRAGYRYAWKNGYALDNDAETAELHDYHVAYA
jgi:hypothetical protein